MYDTEIHWSFPSGQGRGNGQSQPLNEPFHYEAGDFMSVVVFIYLSDVDEQCGLHVMIKGAHKHKTLQQSLTNHLSVEKTVKMCGNRIEAILGPNTVGLTPPRHVAWMNRWRHPRLTGLFTPDSASSIRATSAKSTTLILGPKGTGFFEDLSGYHHRSTGSKPRLILGIHYTMHRNS